MLCIHRTHPTHGPDDIIRTSRPSHPISIAAGAAAAYTRPYLRLKAIAMPAACREIGSLELSPSCAERATKKAAWLEKRVREPKPSGRRGASRHGGERAGAPGCRSASSQAAPPPPRASLGLREHGAPWLAPVRSNVGLNQIKKRALGAGAKRGSGWRLTGALQGHEHRRRVRRHGGRRGGGLV